MNRPAYFRTEAEALRAPLALSAEEFLGGWLAQVARTPKPLADGEEDLGGPPEPFARDVFVDANGARWSVDDIEEAENGP